MNNIEIKINKNTKMVDLSKTIIGNEGESKQGNLIFTFDEFVEGQARLEFEIDGVLDIVYPQKVGESYQLPILSKLTKKGQINMQLVITSGTSEDEVAIFKSNVFYIYCNYSINADEEQPEEYLSWIEIANTKLNQFENVIQIIKTEGTGERFLSDDGTYKIIQSSENNTNESTTNYEKMENLPSINNVKLIGNKTLDELGIQPKGDYALSSEIPTKASQLSNDVGYLTSIPNEYVTETELNAKGYLTEHQDLSSYAKKTDIPTIPTNISSFANDVGYLTSVPSQYVTETELNDAIDNIDVGTGNVSSNVINSIVVVDVLPEIEQDGVLYLVKEFEIEEPTIEYVTNPTMEMGKISSSTGELEESSEYCRTADYVYIKGKPTLTLSNSIDASMNVVCYDENKNFMTNWLTEGESKYSYKRVSSGGTFTFPEDAYYIKLRFSSTEIVEVTITYE